VNLATELSFNGGEAPLCCKEDWAVPSNVDFVPENAGAACDGRGSGQAS